MFGLFSQKKTAFAAKITADGTVFTVKPGDNLLKAALEHGVPWPYSCRVGSCGTCRCRLVTGKIKALNDFSYVLNREELDSGMILACQTSLKSDIEVELALERSAESLAPAKLMKGTIVGTHNLTHDIIQVRIDLDEPMPAYLAGQYAELTVPNVTSVARSYSFASAPSKAPIKTIDFFIRRIPGGQFTEWLHTDDRQGSRVEINGPHGSFWLRKSNAPMLCVAGGSGLAPIKSLLEQMAGDGFKRPVKFLFGARTEQDLYCLDDMRRLEGASGGHFNFVPVLSAEPEDSIWTGERGLVADFINDEVIDLPNAHAYLCGPPPMVDAAIKRLDQAGVPPDRIYYDKFFDASSIPGGR